jgi:VanZ family protein
MDASVAALKVKSLKLLQNMSLWLFWPGVALIVWGELTPHPPDLSSFLAWDKAQHFTAYFGLAAMATMVLGVNRRLVWAMAGVILLGGALEILQGYTGRDPDIFDFLANTLGALSGATIGTLCWVVLRGRILVDRPAPD